MTKRTNNFPKARTDDLITERVGGELVVYDGQTSEAHCLSAIASAVFTAADGNTSPADLAAIAGAELGETVDVPQVERALGELEERGLIEVVDNRGISRRHFVQRSALVGGAVVAGSMVTSVVTPAYGSTGSLPQGVPSCGFSSLAVQITQGANTFGAHWSSGVPSNGANPTNFGADEANANCPASPWTVSDSGWPTGVDQPVYNSVSGGACISVPAGYVVTEIAAFFGKGAPGVCGSQQCIIVTNPSLHACGYVLTFDPSCFSQTC